jgi:hypothetical protein
MEYFTLLAPKPGAVAPKFEKRTADVNILQIDCSPLISNNELIYGSVAISANSLLITEIKPKSGKYIRFKVSGGPINIPHEDYKIVFSVQTSTGNEISIPITIRAYSK